MTQRSSWGLCFLTTLASSACVVTTGQAPAPAPAPAYTAMPPPAPPPAAQVARAVPIAPPVPVTRTPGMPVPQAVPPPAAVAERPMSPRFQMHGPPFVATPEPRERPIDHPRGAALGMPRSLREARVDGLWVWHDERGAGWHLRASTHSQPHRFTGRLWLDEGAFADVRPSRTEWSDRLRASGRSIEFDFQTQGGADGFEFRVANARCVHMILLMDGRADPSAIHVGGGDTHPQRHVFTLCP